MAKKARRLLSRAQALARIEAMYPLLLRDIEIAVAEYGALESANDIIVSELQNVRLAGADCFNIVQQAVAHSLALRIAKLLEIPKPREGASEAEAYNRSDIASLPLLLRLASQERCARVFAQRAREWNPQLSGMADRNERTCREALTRAASSYTSFAKSQEGSIALGKLRNFRNHVLAHNLLSQSRDHFPTYNQIFAAHTLICQVWEQLRLAVSGEHWHMDSFVAHHKEVASRFWKPALRAVIRRGAAG